MKIYAFNGFLYKLPLPGCEVEHIWKWNWDDKKAEAFAKTITEPCIIIGFSDGAGAALVTAQNSEFVKKVYCHSCLYSKYPLKRKFDVSFFITKGDTLIKDGTCQTFIRYVNNAYNCSILDLDPREIKSFNPLHKFMNKHNHHFLNCIDYLPKEVSN